MRYLTATFERGGNPHRVLVEIGDFWGESLPFLLEFSENILISLELTEGFLIFDTNNETIWVEKVGSVAFNIFQGDISLRIIINEELFEIPVNQDNLT